jgi:hypothetical protein
MHPKTQTQGVILECNDRFLADIYHDIGKGIIRERTCSMAWTAWAYLLEMNLLEGTIVGMSLWATIRTHCKIPIGDFEI